jgi:hypothetical protein
MTTAGSFRSWRTITQELATETNSMSACELCEELTKAMEAQRLGIEQAFPPISEKLTPKTDHRG